MAVGKTFFLLHNPNPSQFCEMDTGKLTLHTSRPASSSAFQLILIIKPLLSLWSTPHMQHCSSLTVVACNLYNLFKKLGSHIRAFTSFLFCNPYFSLSRKKRIPLTSALIFLFLHLLVFLAGAAACQGLTFRDGRLAYERTNGYMP